LAGVGSRGSARADGEQTGVRKGNRAPSPAAVRWRNDVLALVFVGLLLGAATFLPPDTTLQQVREAGILRACVPESFPPLVTSDSELPGVDIELLRMVSEELGVRLVLVRNNAIGRDFNPRNWRITRAQCLLIAGGVVDTVTTRGFLVVTEPYLETGWAAVTIGNSATTISGTNVAFFAGLTGLDRLALSTWLRQQGASVIVVSSRTAAEEALTSGRADVLVTEALTAREIAAAVAGEAVWLPGAGARAPIGFGMWKGDLTLERAVERALRRIAADGRLAQIMERYELQPIEEECRFCA